VPEIQQVLGGGDGRAAIVQERGRMKPAIPFVVDLQCADGRSAGWDLTQRSDTRQIERYDDDSTGCRVARPVHGLADRGRPRRVEHPYVDQEARGPGRLVHSL